MPKSDCAPEKPGGRARLIAGLVGVTAVAIFCAFVWVTPDSPDKNAQAEASPPKSSVDSSPEQQRARSEFIDHLIISEVFQKIERPVKSPHVYVSDRWNGLNDKEKSTALEVVLAYYSVEDPRVDVVIIRDAVTGKRIGAFSDLGLELD